MTRTLFAASISLAVFACGGAAVPEPRGAAEQLADAVARKDARAVHAMLDQESQRAVTVEQVQAMLSDGGPQIQQVARAVSRPRAKARVVSSVVLTSGERIELQQEGSAFYIAATSGLPRSAVTPLDAVASLRAAIVERSYAGLISLLTVELSEQLEQRLASLAESLQDEEVLDVQVHDNHAVVNTADGHRVELELQEGVWKISDFE